MKKLLILLLILLFPVATQAQVIISEIMYDPSGTDSGHEWVELYNNGPESVSIDSDWRFSDGSNHTLNLQQGTSTLASQQFAIIADNSANFLMDYPNYSGSLFDSSVNIANSSSTIALKTDKGAQQITALTFDSSWGAASNGKTLEKKVFSDSDSHENWQESYIVGGTPGLISSLPPQPLPTTTIDYSVLRLSELLPNPVGDDAAGEWIEIENTSDQSIDLTGVILGDSSSSRYVWTAEIISPHQFIIVTRVTSGLALNNSNESVTLESPDHQAISSTSYTTSIEGRSWALINGQWQWSKQPTPGAINVSPENRAPMADFITSKVNAEPKESIVFDASSSSDPDSDEISYAWDFGDGDSSSRKSISHKFTDAGQYIVRLQVRDSEGLANEKTATITIVAKESAVVTTMATSSVATTTPAISWSEGIDLSEFLPNPTGSDQGEWIELYNGSDDQVDLSGWKLDDAENGSKPFLFPQGTFIKSQEYQVWPKATTKLSLNNDQDSVRLLWPNDKVIDSVDYQKSLEGKSYERTIDDDEWQWQASPTPGQPQIQVLGLDTTTNELTATTTPQLEQQNSIKAQVIVPAGVWAKQRAFVRLTGTDSWTEIYQYKGDFPEMKVGDIITIYNPTNSETSGVERLKIASRDQVQIVGHDDLTWDDPVSIATIDDSNIDTAATITGTVDTSSKKAVSIHDDEGETMKIALATDTSELIKKGSTVTVHGIVQKNNAGLYLRLISNQDLLADKEVGTIDWKATTTENSVPAKAKDWSGLITGIVTAISAAAYAGYKWWFVK